MADSLIGERYQIVLERMARAAETAGRSPEEVGLVVVTKAHSPETVRQAIEAGARVLGENYVQEGVEKMAALRAAGVDLSQVEWHMIGHVQSRKAALIAGHFSVLHSLDRVKLAQRLSRFAGEAGHRLPVLVQLNVSGEEGKSGLPAWDGRHQSEVCQAVEEIIACAGLEVQGLMTIPPWSQNPEQARPYFRRLRAWMELLARHFPQTGWRHLSMGMSDDFEVAIQEGATLVRIGRAILGPRAGA